MMKRGRYPLIATSPTGWPNRRNKREASTFIREEDRNHETSEFQIGDLSISFPRDRFRKPSKLMDMSVHRPYQACDYILSGCTGPIAVQSLL